jgi:hypothetical protein
MVIPPILQNAIKYSIFEIFENFKTHYKVNFVSFNSLVHLKCKTNHIQGQIWVQVKKTWLLVQLLFLKGVVTIFWANSLLELRKRLQRGKLRLQKVKNMHNSYTTLSIYTRKWMKRHLIPTLCFVLFIQRTLSYELSYEASRSKCKPAAAV